MTESSATVPSPSHPKIWGIVNVTPDSFSDGGLFADTEAAVRHALELERQGADVLDIGGESTRPGADDVSVDAELARVLPVIEALRAAGCRTPLSIDTRRAAVAAPALAAGATIVNDVGGGRGPGMLNAVATAGASLVLMHMQGTPRTMQAAPVYTDVVAEVGAWLARRIDAAERAGIPRSRLWIDPGIGFGKRLGHNVDLLRGLERLQASSPGTRLLLGASRKSFLGQLTGRTDAASRLAGSLACVARAVEAGIDAVRVHDVAESHDLRQVLCTIQRGS